MHMAVANIGTRRSCTSAELIHTTYCIIRILQVVVYHYLKHRLRQFSGAATLRHYIGGETQQTPAISAVLKWSTPIYLEVLVIGDHNIVDLVKLSVHFFQ